MKKITPTYLPKRKPGTYRIKAANIPKHTPPIIEAYENEHGDYHRENGPAILTETTVYFIEHGRDWTQEKYETFIRQTAKKLFPGQNLNYPFNQIESIVLATKNWGTKQNLYKPPPFKMSIGNPKGGTGKTISFTQMLKIAQQRNNPTQ